MVWPRQKELEWSGCLLGNVVLLLMYDGVSALCLPCPGDGKCRRFLDCPFSTLCYPKPHLRTRNSLLSQLGNNHLYCHSSAAHWASLRSCLSMEEGSSCSLSHSGPFLCSLQVANDIYLLTLISTVSALMAPRKKQK